MFVKSRGWACNVGCLRLEGSVHHVGINVFLRNRVSCKSIHRDAKKARVMAAQIIKES